MITIQNYNQSDHKVLAADAAQKLFIQARSQSWLDKIQPLLGGRPRRLLNLAEVQATCAGLGQRELGRQGVALNQIRGSANEGRRWDFDADFRPLKSHTESRWLNVATAQLRGVKLPPITLIQVDEVYFVQDGHHRISVAKALGQAKIEAMVTVWQVAGPLPWARHGEQRQSAPGIILSPEPATLAWDSNPRLIAQVG